MLSFGNEINIWSKALFLKVLANPDVSTLFLPSITLDTSLIAKNGEHFLRIREGEKITLGTCVSPRWVSLEELKEYLREIRKFYDDKEIVISLAYHRISSFSLLVEKIKNIFEEIDGLELNLIPSFYKVGREERELMLLKTAEILRTMESLSALNIYVKAPLIGIQGRHIETLIDGGAEYVILSLHRIIRYKNSIYALHSPYLARILLEYIPLTLDPIEGYRDKVGISADFSDIKHLHKFSKEYRLIQLDFNLLNRELFSIFGEESGEKIQLISIRHPEFKAFIDVSTCNKCEDRLLCVKICPENAINPDGEQKYPRVDFTRCKACGLCIAVCPKEAIHWIRIISPE